MARTPGYDKYGRRKGKWTPEEDRKLRDFLTKYGYTNWSILPKLAGLSRCGKSCRLRWLNYLRPDVKRGMYSKDEEEIIVRLHGMLGNKWSAIAACLPGRSDNEVKNHWHTYLKKRLLPEQSSSPVTTASTAGTNPDLPIKQAIISKRSVEPLMTHLDRISSSNSPATNPVTGLEPDILPLPSSSPLTMTYSSSQPVSSSDIESGPTRVLASSWELDTSTSEIEMGPTQVPANSWELDTSTGDRHVVSPGRFWTEPFMSETSFDMPIPGCYSERSLYEEHWSFMFESPALYSLW